MSFWEMLVIVVVGLLVVGPDKLPGAIRSGMLWFGRVKRIVNDTRVEFEQQLGVDEIRRELHNEKVMESLKALEQAQNEVASDANELKNELAEKIKQIQDSSEDPVPHDHHDGEFEHHDGEFEHHGEHDPHHGDYDPHHEELDHHLETDANPDTQRSAENNESKHSNPHS